MLALGIGIVKKELFFYKYSLQIEGFSFHDLNRYNGTDDLLWSFEVDRFKTFRSAGQRVFVVLTDSFHQYRKHQPFQGFVLFQGKFIHQVYQSVEPFVLHILRHLVFILLRRCSLSDRIKERKGGIVFHVPHQAQCILKILFCFSRKANDDVGSEGDVRPSLPKLPNQVQIVLPGVLSVHPLQDPVAAGLYRKMDMTAEFITILIRPDQFR